MTITRLHISLTILIALALHASLAAWLSLSVPAPSPDPTPPLRLSLLAPVAETAVTESTPIAEPPPPQQVSEPAPKLIAKPRPMVQSPPPEPQRPIEPEPELAESKPEIATPELPPPMADNVAPLDVATTIRYEQLLVAWLEKHKKYPLRAKRLRIEGDGMLRILINREGQTQQVTLEQRTGNRLLDKAALEMAQRADPFPPMPENDPRRELEFIVPVVFVLR